MREFEGKSVFLTGAASGIGRSLALRLAAEGCRLFLADIDEAGLNRIAAELRQRSVDVTICVCDLCDPAAITRATTAATTQLGGIDLLINNAGVAYYGQMTRMTQQQWNWVMSVNLLAPIQITHELLPAMLLRPDSHIVNMCSISGLVAGGRLAAYHTSKFGLVGFTESLRAEFGRRGLGVTAVCPGPVRTELYSATASDSPERSVPSPPRWLSTTPERVAEITVRSIRRNRRQVLITPMAHGLFLLKRFVPGLIDFANQFSRKKQQRQRQLRQMQVSGT